LAAQNQGKKSKKLSESKEDYLEAIYHIEKENKVARVKEIAESLGVRMPSVTGALKVLAREELVEHSRYGYVELTPQGKKLASAICARHENITLFLMKFLDLDQPTADKDACRIEHAVSPLTFKRLSKLVEFVEQNPDEAEKIFDRFREYF
jgi:DtxR family transcriptional regulator, Mn-dependent transcriptional regulator